MPLDLSIKLPKSQYKTAASLRSKQVHNVGVSDEDLEKLDIPVVAYPPFKLRSSMYEKDPLIWAGLLLTYIEYMKFIYSTVTVTFEDSESSQFLDSAVLLSRKLSGATINETKKFVGKYLRETSYERDHILTLGDVNVDITDRNSQLRNLIFCIIEKLGLLYFETNGELIWDFIKIYVKGNAFKVREMLLYPIISNSSTNKESLVLINSLRNHLEQLITDGKFNSNNADIEILAILLGLVNKLENNKQNNKKDEFFQKKIDKFINKFVDLKWIQILERYFNDGNSIHSKTCQALMLISLMSCSLEKLANLIDLIFEKFNLSSKKQLRNEFKLFSAVINTEYFQSKISNGNSDLLTEKLGKVLRNHVDNYVSEDEIQQILMVFPDLTSFQVRRLLEINKGKPINDTINELLENPEKYHEMMNNIDKANSINKKETVAKDTFNPKNVILGKKQQLKFNDLNSKEIYDSDDNTLRKKTLELSLSLMYNNDEDEPDDTYVDAEIAQSEAVGNTSNNKNNEELKNQFIKDEKLKNIEMYLYTIYTKNPSAADRSGESRRSKLRKEIIEKTGWSNEQIEGWFYMLNKDHSKKSNLESLLIFNRGEVKLMSKKNNDAQEQKNNGNKKNNKDTNKEDKIDAKSNKLHQQRRKEQNKARSANHNRKKQHSKKMAQVI